ncbi:MAG: glycosyltransferase family 4 protein [Deltaproteobacteria bacterium]|nr:glycosyltransferase family 4 protein [Deltaproteobacteria bacterium]
MGKNIGFVSTRFAGTDGVSLEAAKWSEILERIGHRCFWFAGDLDHDPERSLKVPEAFFKHEANKAIDVEVFGRKRRSRETTQAIHDLRTLLKIRLYEFIDRFRIDMLVAQNLLTIPMHLPLGLAMTEVIAETLIPTVAHHHDFYWERTRFSVNAVGDYLRMAFPPSLPNIQHVVINSAAQEELALRTGLSSVIIPNVLDFENPPQTDEKDTHAFRSRIGLVPDDFLILQPTRIVQRKGIEHAIDLVHQLGNQHFKLVISHEAGDEGIEYADWLKDHARERGVDLRLIATSVPDAPDRPSLWDLYAHADFITYPSLYEGFGNAFLEAVYFKKPLLINRYAIFVRDIEPKSFDLIVMDGYLTKKNVQKVREVLENPDLRERMTAHNYAVAARHYSYAMLKRQLDNMMANCFGVNG